jgi:hypothetical protein
LKILLFLTIQMLHVAKIMISMKNGTFICSLRSEKVSRIERSLFLLGQMMSQHAEANGQVTKRWWRVSSCLQSRVAHDYDWITKFFLPSKFLVFSLSWSSSQKKNLCLATTSFDTSIIHLQYA